MTPSPTALVTVFLRRFVAGLSLLWVCLTGAATAQTPGTPANGAPPLSYDPQPPIPIRFTLQDAGYVTVVIDDAQGNRVRNLIGETFFAAGENTVYWDGLDESGVVPGTPSFTYSVQGKLVEPAKYHVRGLVRKPIELRYELTANCPGSTPWETEDRTGAWLADHTFQTSVVPLPDGTAFGPGPQMLLGSVEAEGGSSVIWVDLEGKKLHGNKSAGRQGTQSLCVDRGRQARGDIQVYSLDYQGTLGVFGLNREGTPSLLFSYATHARYLREDTNHLCIAVYDAMAAISLPAENKILLVDLRNLNKKGMPGGKYIGTVDVQAPAGLMFDAAGKLYAVVGREVRTYDVDWQAVRFDHEKRLITGLEDPHKLAADRQGNLYVTDWGSSNQVKVFSPQGQPLRTIGKAGPLQVGPYDPQGMTMPNGIAISPDGRLWVAESSYLPKRCSVWTLDGRLWHSFIGPSPYAGGGILDPLDKTRFYFSPHSGCLEFKLDWDRGTYDLASVLFRPKTPGNLEMHDKDNVNQVPHFPIYAHGRQYLTNVYNENDGPLAAGIWMVEQGRARLVAAVGVVRTWSVLDEAILAGGYLQSHLPEGVKYSPIEIAGKRIPLFNRMGASGRPERVNLIFAWSDLNHDNQVQPEEVTFAWTGHPMPSWVVGDGLTATNSYGDQLAVQGFTPQGVPLYDAGKVQRLAHGKIEVGQAHRQPVVGRDGSLVVTGGPIEGFRNGQRKWVYHSCWPTGMSKGRSPKPQFGGQLLNTLELLGPTVQPPGTDVEIWGIAGDYGNLFLLTTDGLFVGTLFRDARLAASPYWPAPARRNLLLNDCTLLEECYYPTMIQTADGQVYLQAGKNRSSIVRVDGLESIRRIDAGEISVMPDMLRKAREYFVLCERQRPRPQDRPLTVLLASAPPQIDGDLSDWSAADWVEIDGKTRAALMIAGDRLFAAFSTMYDLPLANHPESLSTIFKGGSLLDLFLGTDLQARPDRQGPVLGDLRLCVSQINQKTAAVLMRAVDPTSPEPVKYQSPIGSVTLDRVTDVSPSVQLAGRVRTEAATGRKYYEYEFSVPLAVLGLKVEEGSRLRGDVGILRGRPGMTLERLYWHNRAAGHTADLPSEAQFVPDLWGTWCVSRTAPPKVATKK